MPLLVDDGCCCGLMLYDSKSIWRIAWIFNWFDHVLGKYGALTKHVLQICFAIQLQCIEHVGFIDFTEKASHCRCVTVTTSTPSALSTHRRMITMAALRRSAACVGRDSWAAPASMTSMRGGATRGRWVTQRRATPAARWTIWKKAVYSKIYSSSNSWLHSVLERSHVHATF